MVVSSAMLGFQSFNTSGRVSGPPLASYPNPNPTHSSPAKVAAQSLVALVWKSVESNISLSRVQQGVLSSALIRKCVVPRAGGSRQGGCWA